MLNTKHHHSESGDFHKLPAGLVNENVELFSDNGSLKGTHKGHILHFEDLPAKVKLYFSSIFDAAKCKNQDLEKVLADIFQCKTYEDDLQQFTICNYGGFDNRPDFNHSKEPKKEYWNCGNRGVCKAEGIVCQPNCITETNLSIRETEIIKQISCGKQDKEIADYLQLADSTVQTHVKNIRAKLNMNNRGEIIRFAFQNNIAL